MHNTNYSKFEVSDQIEVVHYDLQFTLEHFDMRLDAAIAQLLSQYSRTKIKDWILGGHVKVDQEVVTEPAFLLTGFESCSVDAQIPVLIGSQPENIPLDIVYEDEQIIVINKPANFVVHPGAGKPNGTVLNALLYHYPELQQVPGSGIVHRIDKDTTGLMVVARTIEAQVSLAEQLAKKEVTREYEALVHGLITKGGRIDAPIGPHPRKRGAMAVTDKGRPAVTNVRVMETFRNYSRLRIRLETGRTHQIRVHMAHTHHPLLGDVLYGGSIRLPKAASATLTETLRGFKRQALHALKLILIHPSSGEEMTFEVPLPADMAKVTRELQKDRDDYFRNHNV